MSADGKDPARGFAGDRPSAMILVDDLDAATLGALIAFHEHRVFAGAVLMGINPFDQFGVELGKKIETALMSLGEDQRMVFVLREYEGLAYSDIASITDCSEGTVKSRIHRAKDALRFRLRSLVLDAQGGLS